MKNDSLFHDSDSKDNAKMHLMTGIYADTHFNPLLIKNEVNSISDYSAGLGASFVSTNFSENYNNVLTSQRNNVDSIFKLSSEYEFKILDVSSFIDNTILPVASTFADLGLVTANATKLFSNEIINPKQFSIAQDFSGLVLGAIKEQQHFINGALSKIKSSGMINLSGSSGPWQMFNSGIGEMVRSFPTYPTDHYFKLPDLEIVREKVEVTDKEIIQQQNELDSILAEINPDLVEFRKGSWRTFTLKGYDYIGQSSSSMRRLVDTLLRELAPEEKVKRTEYFKSDPLAKSKNGSSTRKAKIYYIVNWDRSKTEHIERLAKGFLETYDNLTAWDHVPLKKDKFIHGVFVAIEGLLFSLLSVARSDQ